MRMEGENVREKDMTKTKTEIKTKKETKTKTKIEREKETNTKRRTKLWRKRARRKYRVTHQALLKGKLSLSPFIFSHPHVTNSDDSSEEREKKKDKKRV